MFERAAQVNARFEGGASRQAEIVAALHELGVPDERINVIERADPGDWREPAAKPGFLARLLGRFGGGRGPGPAAPTPALLILVHLGQDDTLSGPVQDVFRRFGATSVEHFAPSRVPTRVFGAEGTVPPAEVEDQPGARPPG
jgi:hypothetical protein